MFVRSLRLYFTRLRLSMHPLRMQTGRYARNNTPREERYCLVCNSTDIEDEYHFICICPCYTDIRKKYLKRYYYVRPSVYKYLDLLKTCIRKDIVGISLYVKEALVLRNAILNIDR